MNVKNILMHATLRAGILLSISLPSTRLCAFDTIWVRDTVPPQSRSTSARDIATDSLSFIYVTGSTDGNLAPTHTGGNDPYLMKYDTAGNVVWAREFGSTNSDYAQAVAADSLNNVVVVGDTFGSLAATSLGGQDAFVRKYDSAGNTLWTRQYGSAKEDEARGAATDFAGNVFVTGSSYTPGLSNSADAYLRKYDTSGNLVWQKTIDSTADDYGYTVATDALGSSYVAGITYGSLASPKFGGPFDNDAFLSKFAADGTLLWTRQFGTISYDVPQNIVVDALGNSYVAGYLSSLAFVEKFDTAGNSLWTQQLPIQSTAYSVALDNLGSVYISGLYGNINAVQFLARYSTDGTPVTLLLDSSPSVSAPSIAIDPNNSMYLFTGYYAGNNMDGLRLMKLAPVPEPATLSLVACIAVVIRLRRLKVATL